jgi:O-antigen ligase
LLVGGGGLLLLVVALQTAGISLLEYVVETHLAKLTEEAGSGAIRFYAVQYSLTEVFAKSPLFGVGYGSHRALSLIIVLLANIGVIGVLAFLAFNGAVFVHAIRTMNRSRDAELASIAFALAVTHPAFLLTLFVGKSETSFSFGWLWLLLAMMEASYRVYQREQSAVRA